MQYERESEGQGEAKELPEGVRKDEKGGSNNNDVHIAKMLNLFLPNSLGISTVPTVLIPYILLET